MSESVDDHKIFDVLMRELNGCDSLTTTNSFRVSFRCLGFVIIDPTRKFTGMPGSGVSSCDGAYLNYIYVRPEHRGKGIGEKNRAGNSETVPEALGFCGDIRWREAHAEVRGLLSSSHKRINLKNQARSMKYKSCL